MKPADLAIKQLRQAAKNCEKAYEESDDELANDLSKVLWNIENVRLYGNTYLLSAERSLREFAETAQHFINKRIKATKKVF